MRVPGIDRRRRGVRPRIVLIVLVVLAFVLLTSMRGIAGFYTDYLWYKGVGFTEVWRGLILAKLVPAVVFTVVFFAVLLVNLIVADRLAPQFRPTTPNEDDLVERYRQVMGPYAGRVRVAVSALLALVAGTGVASQWREWLLFRNRVPFGGAKDPQFHKDIGFYVFSLPFFKYIAEWTFAALVILLIVTALAHYLNGGIRPQGPFQRVTPQVKAHLSVILGLMALLKAYSYWLQRFELSFSTRGFVPGAGYTDVHAQLPALRLLVIISVAAAALLLANIFMRGWMLPIIAVGMWAVVSVVIGAIVPAFVQNFRVNPNERSLERKYIQRNIDATRSSYGLANVSVQKFEYQPDLDAPKVQAASDTIGNARLWDPFPFTTLAVYKQLQQVRPFYQFTDVDIDRYNVNGTVTPAVVSPRELDHNNLPNNTWQNRHLVYTHGYGVVMSPANKTTPEGQPDFIIKDVPPVTNGVDLVQPAIYYGEATDDYALVDTKQKEFDYENGRGEQNNVTCTKCGGVSVSSFSRRFAFWLRFGDINLMTTKQFKPASKILYIRNVRQRVHKAAPFLRFDSDPYAAVVDGRVKWIIDAYTATDRFPYSTPYSPSAQGRLDSTSGLQNKFNYVRNSVKAVVDAYDGTMQFWVVDHKDPIVKAYAKAFPSVFRSDATMPASLRAHLRYPEDIFRVQTDMFATYHIETADVFYARSDQWAVSPDPGTGRLNSTAPAAPAAAPPGGLVTVPQNAPRMDPYYLFMKLPGEQQSHFVLLEPFVPVSKGDSLGVLLGFMVAKSDADDYGKISSYKIQSGSAVKGPVLVDADIRSTLTISRELSLLNQQGSQVLQGSLQLIPIGNSILYIRPYYVQSDTTKLPELREVAAYYNGTAALQPTLQQALAVLFSGLPSAPVQQPSGGVSTPTSSLIDQAAAALDDADKALKAGDLGRYKNDVDTARNLLQQSRSGSPTTSSTRPSA